MLNKKLIIVSSIILLGIAAVIGIYFLFFRKIETTPRPTPTPIVIQTPSLTSSNITFVSQTPYLNPTLAPDGQKIRYFDPATKYFMETENSGLNPVRLSGAEISNVVKINWAPDKSKAIILVDDKGVKKYQYIDLNSGQSFSYGPQYQAIVFSPSSDKIAYNFLAPAKGANKIEMADPSGKNWQNVSTLRIQDLKISWPQTGRLAVSSLSSAFSSSALFLINLTENNLIKLIPESYGLETLWSPAGDKVAFSAVDNKGQGPMLKIAAVSTGEIKDLKIATFAQKCAWSLDNRNLFCAVPIDWPAFKLTLPEDYYRQDFFTNDQILKINSDTAETNIVFSAEENAPDVSNLFLDGREEHLFFINKKDGLFYAVKL